MTLFENASRRVYRSEQLPDPKVVKTVFSSPKMSLIFTPLRLYLGWQWLSAGLEKVNSPAWTRSGVALQGFWTAATKGVPGGKGAAIHYGWYHDFLLYMLNNHWYTWFAKLIAFGETTLGILLIIGAFTGLAAVTGAFMNFNFMLAGSASINPVLFVLAIVVLLGWKVAGFIGADYYLLPLIGTPWQPGHVRDALREGRTAAPIGPRVLGGLGWVAAFGIVGVVAVLANNQWNAGQPVVGYLVTLAAVLLAWIAGEALLTTTHTPTASDRMPAGPLRSQPLS